MSKLKRKKQKRQIADLKRGIQLAQRSTSKVPGSKEHVIRELNRKVGEVERLDRKLDDLQGQLDDTAITFIREAFIEMRRRPNEERPRSTDEVALEIGRAFEREGTSSRQRATILQAVTNIFETTEMKFIDALGFDVAEQLSVALQVNNLDLKRWFDARMKAWPLPPLTSARNVEAFAQGFGYCFGPMGPIIKDFSDGHEGVPSFNRLVTILAEFWPRTMKLAREWLGKIATLDAGIFPLYWLRSGFARVEVSHKLAANLCLTDIPRDIDIRMPFDAWSLVVPDGLFPRGLARIWVTREDNDEQLRLGRLMRPMSLVDQRGDAYTPDSEEERRMIGNLVCGVCLAMSNPDDFGKTETALDGPPGTPKRHRAAGEPDFNQARFMLAAPVRVDMREHVRGVLTGQHRGGIPTVQFIVRGHWRNQAHGPGHQLRKQIWIQPFWKGPEETAILLRSHKVDPS